MRLFVLDNELREAQTASVNSLGEPIGKISLGILDGPNPQCEGLPGDVVFPGLLQVRPWYARCLSFRRQPRRLPHSPFELTWAPEALGFRLDHCVWNLPVVL